VLGGLRYALAIGSAPSLYRGGVQLGRAAEACLAAMRTPGGCERRFRQGTAGSGALRDCVAFYLRDLCQYGDDQFTNTAGDPAQTTDFDGHTHTDELAYHVLDIQCVTAKPIDRVNMQRVAFAQIF
jgi:hypothetical protein